MTGADPGGHGEITQCTDHQMPEQQEGAAPASSEADRSAIRMPARSASACGRRARRGSGYADAHLPVQGPCR